MTGANAVALRESPLESERFGLRVFRTDVQTIDAAAIAAAIDQARVDVLILRLPAQEIGSIAALAALGLAPIVGDTLVHYDTDLTSNTQPAPSSVTLRPASRDDRALLMRMAHEIFAGYVSHYHANPLFAPQKILDGYAEWAARHAGAEDGSAAWLVERDGELAGFSCYRLDLASGTATGVLNGILPRARGRGGYREMFRAMLTALADAGMARFEISTQVHNLAVQRVWAANGLALCHAANTVHVNALRTQVSTLSSNAPVPDPGAI